MAFRHARMLAALAMALVVPSLAQEPAPVTLFVHVNVLPMDSERVLTDHAVLVRDGAIAEIAPSIEPPPGARVIDGKGTAWLSPGLADMHVHSTTARDMKLFLANGVTTVLSMGGARPRFMDIDVPRLNRGEQPGPHVYAGFVVDGKPDYGQFVIATPEQARGIVGIAKANGFDFIKVYNNISPETFDALIEEGREQGVPVIGHGVTRVGLEKQLAAGQMLVAHTEEFFYTVFFRGDEDPGNAPPRDDQIAPVVAMTKASGAFVTADIVTYAIIARQWGRPEVVEQLLRLPTIRYLDPSDRLRWRSERYGEKTGSLDERAAFMARFTKAMADADIPMVAGTDVPTIPGLVPGFATHEGLKALEEAGLTRFQLLSTATRFPGAFIAKAKPGSQPFGTVAVGSRADLVLTAANPLDGLATLETPLGVMSHGRWHDAAALKALLESVAADYEAVETP